MFTQENWKPVSTQKHTKCLQQHFSQKSQKAGTAQVSIGDEWINKMGYFHTMEYFWATKRNEVLIPATCVNLKNILPMKEASHIGPHIVCFHLCDMFRIGESLQTDWWLPKVGRLVGKRSDFSWRWDFFWGWWEYSRIGCGDGGRALWTYYKAMEWVNV